jgi:hypothetical protein
MASLLGGCSLLANEAFDPSRYQDAGLDAGRDAGSERDAGRDASRDAGIEDSGADRDGGFYDGGVETDGGTDGGTVLGPLCDPAEVGCTEESVLMLSLFPDANDAAIENSADGAGFASHVDATAGGPTPTLAYVYARFTDGGLERVDIGDEEAFDSMEWDIAFRRFIIRLNSGVSGPSCVEAARTPGDTDYDSLTTTDDTLAYATEAYFTEACGYVPDGSGLATPGTVLQTFWEYPGCVQMTGNVFVIRLANGRQVKLTVTAYYDVAYQEMCDSASMIGAGPTGAGNLRMRWAFLEPSP